MFTECCLNICLREKVQPGQKNINRFVRIEWNADVFSGKELQERKLYKVSFLPQEAMHVIHPITRVDKGRGSYTVITLILDSINNNQVVNN